MTKFANIRVMLLNAGEMIKLGLFTPRVELVDGKKSKYFTLTEKAVADYRNERILIAKPIGKTDNEFFNTVFESFKALRRYWQCLIVKHNLDLAECEIWRKELNLLNTTNKVLSIDIDVIAFACYAMDKICKRKIDVDKLPNSEQIKDRVYQISVDVEGRNE